VIGTPTEETWPGVSTLPEYKPFSIYQPILSLVHFVPKLNNNGKDLLLVSIYVVEYMCLFFSKLGCVEYFFISEIVGTKSSTCNRFTDCF